jgi:ribonuclease P protein component
LIRPIRSRRSFARLRRDGVRVRIDPLWCSHIHDPLIRPPEVAFAVGRGYGTAVRRNRLRRRIRGALQDMTLPPGLYLFGATAAADRLSATDLRETLHRLMERLDTVVTRSVSS